MEGNTNHRKTLQEPPINFFYASGYPNALMLLKKIVVELEKNWSNGNLYILTNTLYNLHIYIEEFKILHVNTFESKYINIVNSSNFFSSILHWSQIKRSGLSKYQLE